MLAPVAPGLSHARTASAGSTVGQVQGTYTRDVHTSQADAWRLTWGREGWRVIRAEPVPLRVGAPPAADVVVRYTLQRTPDARHLPSTA
jgi:hypothetical protein